LGGHIGPLLFGVGAVQIGPLLFGVGAVQIGPLLFGVWAVQIGPLLFGVGAAQNFLDAFFVVLTFVIDLDLRMFICRRYKPAVNRASLLKSKLL
jgi:hypothetical protein